MREVFAAGEVTRACWLRDYSPTRRGTSKGGMQYLAETHQRHNESKDRPFSSHFGLKLFLARSVGPAQKVPTDGKYKV